MKVIKTEALLEFILEKSKDDGGLSKGAQLVWQTLLLSLTIWAKANTIDIKNDSQS